MVSVTARLSYEFFYNFVPLLDIVFFIFLYQRYIYKVDLKRVNEFGFSAEMLEKKAKDSQVNGEPAAIEAAATPKTEAEKKDD